MSKQCGKCKVSASSRELIRCFGSCKTAYHPLCVDSKMDSWGKLFKECPYAKFVCSECQRDSDNTTAAELMYVKDKITNLSDMVMTLSKRIDDGFKKIDLDSSERLSRDTQLAPAADDARRVYSANGSSVPILRPPTGCIIGSCKDAEETIKAAQEKKYIYASKFSNATLPAAVSKFLSEKLGVSEDVFDCRLLVSANKDVSLLNFVSFKIGIDPELFQKLLQPDIWPCGVLVREFVHRPKNFIPAVVG